MLMMPLIHAHDAAHRLDDGVISRIAGERPGLTEPRRGSIDQARINLREFVVREAKMLHRARPKILSDHVRFAYHIEKDSPVGIIFQIEGDALLAAVDEAEIKGLILDEWSIGPRIITVPRRLDLDNSSAEIA